MKIKSWTISRRIITGFTACLLINAGLEIFAVRQINNRNANIEDYFPAPSGTKTRFSMLGDQPFKPSSADEDFANSSLPRFNL